MTRQLQVQTQGVKLARTTQLSFGKRTLVSAPNESGKSMLAESIRFAALGFIPALGKTNQATAALMCGDQMRVLVELEDGRTFYREMNRGPKGVLSGAVECSWLKNAKPTEHAQEILQLFGKEEADVAEVMDIRELLKAPPNKRAERIEAILDAGAQTPETLAERIAELTTRRLAEKEDAELEDWRVLIPVLPPTMRENLKEIAGMLAAKVKDGGAPSALTWSNKEKRANNTELKKKVQARKELETRLENLPRITKEDVASLKLQRTKVLEGVGALKERAEAAHQEKLGFERLQDEVHDTGNEVQRAKALAEQAEEAKARLKGLKTRLTKETNQAKKLNAPPSPDLSDAEEQDALAAEAETEANRFRVEDIEPPRDEERRLLHAKQNLDHAERSPWKQVHDIACELDGDPRMAKTDSGWVEGRLHDIIDIADKQLGGIEELREQVTETQAAYNVAMEAYNKAQVNRMDRVRRKKRLMDEVRQHREKAEEIRGRILRDHRQATKAYDEKREALLSHTQQLRRDIDRDEAIVKRAGHGLKDAERRYQEAQQRLANAGDPPDIPKIRKEIDELLAKADTLAKQSEEALTNEAQRHTLELMIADIKSLEVCREIFTAVEWACQRVREEGIASTGGSCIATMTAFLEGAERDEVPYFDSRKGQVYIGWRKDGNEVGVQVMSGFGYTLFCAALTAAILVARGAPLRILLVEAGEVDRWNLPHLLNGIAAVDDGLTASIVMTHLGMDADLADDITGGWEREFLEGVRV
jgi:hypothetical protein